MISALISNLEASCAMATMDFDVANDDIAEATPLTVKSLASALMVAAVDTGTVQKVWNLSVVLTAIVKE